MEVVEDFSDRDTSAYKRGVKRPAYEALLEALRQRRVDVVVAWKTDRITGQRDHRDRAVPEGAGGRAPATR